MPEKKLYFEPLPFEVDSEVDESLITAHAGVPLVVELFRASGAAGVVDAEVRVKQRQRGLKVSELVESLVALWVAGGERCEDLNRLRQDRALAELLGHELPAANTMRDFLEEFHLEDLPLWRAGEKAAVPEESAPLRGLGEANRQLLRAIQKASPPRRATLDVDATIVASQKRTATTAYDGTQGYQPVVAVWAEQDAIVQEEFRDGNVPAGCGNRRILEAAFGALPAGEEEKRLRADSALYQNEVLFFCEESGIGYAISADLTPQLRAEILALPESAWAVEGEEGDAVREWAEAAYVPEDGDHRKNRPCLRRYLAVRVVKKQGALFADGSGVKYFAVVTNREGDGLELLRWHREKAGTVEHTHHVLKNELAAGALPSGKFGANAGWFRVNVLTYNLLSLLKRASLPGEFWTARPKRLRFLLFNTVGKVVHHARRMLLRLGSEVHRRLFERVRGKILALGFA
jgi:hypothetical protein